MSEKTILVCDDCGRQAIETAKITTSRGTFERDVCALHRDQLSTGRRPRRGRPKKERVGMKAKGRVVGDAVVPPQEPTA